PATESVSPTAGLEPDQSRRLQDTHEPEPEIATTAEPATESVSHSDGVGAHEVLQQQGNLEQAQALEIRSTPAQQPKPVSPVGSLDAGGVAPDTSTQQPVGEGETNRTTATETEEEPQQAPAAAERVGEVAPSAGTQDQRSAVAENSTSGE
nr:hypothetical protein [Oscillatoria princeps RMCB-10]